MSYGLLNGYFGFFPLPQWKFHLSQSYYTLKNVQEWKNSSMKTMFLINSPVFHNPNIVNIEKKNCERCSKDEENGNHKFFP